MHIADVIAANRLVLRLSKARRQPGANVPRLDRLVERANKRAERKQRKFTAGL